MALKHPTHASPFRIGKLIFLAIFSPKRFQDEEDLDGPMLELTPSDTRTRIDHIRSSFWRSFLTCVAAICTGFLISHSARAVGWYGSTFTTTLLLIGAFILLWATLTFQGWQVQSYSGVTLGERLNRWIFRSLYFLGTALIAAGTLGSTGA